MDNKIEKLRNYFKRWPRFYYFVGAVFGPLMYTGLSSKRFLKYYMNKNKVFNIGSGVIRLGTNVINMDLSPYKNIDIVADINRLPLQDGKVKGIICDTVLEHVKNPEQVINEIHRVLSPDSLAYITVPFLYPYHPSPADFTRWTKQGFLNLIRDFEVVEFGVRCGAFSALTTCICYVFALIFSFGNKTLYWLLVNLSMFIFFPLKFIDLIFVKLPQANDMAAVMYYVVRRKKQ